MSDAVRLRSLPTRLRVALIVGAAFALRLAWLLHARPEPVSDYLWYYRLGQNLIDKGHLGLAESSAQALPGHPLLLAALMLISRSTLWLSLAMVILSTVTVGLVYVLARRLTRNETVALVAAGVAAVSPTFVLYSPVLGTEHLFAVLMLGSLLLTLRLRPEDTWTALGAGAVTGLAVLTRGEAVFYLPVLAAVVWWTNRASPRRTRLRLVSLMAVAVVAVVTPWIVRNAVVVRPGIYLSTVGGMNFYSGHNPDGYGWSPDVPWDSDLEANEVGWELGLAYIRERPNSILESIRDGTYNLFASPDYALFWSTQSPVPGTDDFVARFVPLQGVLGKALPAAAAFYLAMAGAAVLLWRRWSSELRIVVVGLVSASWLGHAVLLFAHPRFRYFLDIVFTVVIALTLVTLGQVGRQTSEEEPTTT
ncbi:MAG: glycosyltransferase family 39 protein [Acidimicrobiia bacterium]